MYTAARNQHRRKHIGMGGEKRTTGWILFQRVAGITMVTAGHTSWFIYVAFATHTLPSKTKGNALSQTLHPPHSLCAVYCTLSVSLVVYYGYSLAIRRMLCCNAASAFARSTTILSLLLLLPLFTMLYDVHICEPHTKIKHEIIFVGKRRHSTLYAVDAMMYTCYVFIFCTLCFVCCVLRVEGIHTCIFHLEFSVFVSCFRRCCLFFCCCCCSLAHDLYTGCCRTVFGAVSNQSKHKIDCWSVYVDC